MNPDVSVDQTTQRPVQPPTVGNVPGVSIPFATLTATMATSKAFAKKSTSLPPAPMVSSPLAAITNGFQMAFTQLTSPTATGNTIDSYRIYRNTTVNGFQSS